MSKQKPDKHEGNLYDKIIKENLTGLMPAIFRTILKITDFRIENLPEIKQQTTIEVEPDFLKLIYNKDYPKGAIVQVEFESDKYSKMDGRLLEYLGILYKKYQIPILQYVVFIGKGKAKILNKIAFEKFHYEFPVINLEELDYREFIKSDNSEEVILTILTDFQNLKADEVIELIVQRLIELNGESVGIYKFIKQLAVLARLRNLQKFTIAKTNEIMRLNLNMYEDELFIEGHEKGMEKGLEKGLTQGLEKGLAIRAIIATKNMLQSGLSISQIANFLSVKETFVKHIQKELKQSQLVIDLINTKKLTAEEIAKTTKVSVIFVEAIQTLHIAQ